MNRKTFEELVVEVLDALPEEFQTKLANVDVVVEDWPDSQTLRQAGVDHRSQLLGFYHGVPLTARNRSYTLVLPDKISIYRMPILMRCRSSEEVAMLVHRVVLHELAHHFGLSDDRLLEIGAY